MSQQQLLEKVVPVLTGLGIEYMITGSIASSMQGEPRSTHDIDLVVQIPSNAIGPLLDAFPMPDFLLQEEAIRDALRHRSMFNLLSLNDGEKVDFWIFADDPFDQSRFRRRQKNRLGSVEVQVSAPEDTILAKLRWAKLSGGSEKQMKDARRIYQLQGDSLDQSYLRHWAVQIGVEDLREELQRAAKSSDA
jgi:hypothetical protein